jgi:hypothetical protein
MRPVTLFTKSLLLAAPALLVAQALAGPVEVVFTNAGSDPTGPRSLVPGTLGSTDGLRLNNFGRMFRSPTSNQWCVVATMVGTGVTGTTDQVFIIGSGQTGFVQIREGNTIAGGPEVLGFGVSAARVNDSGQWAIAFPAGSITSTTNSRLLTWNGSAFTMIRIGDTFPGIASTTYSGTFNSTNISNTGVTSFLASAAGFPGVFPIGDSGTTLLLNQGVDAPAGQLTPTPATWTTFTTDRFYQDATLAHSIILGALGFDTNTNLVAVVDGVVKVQKGFVIPGSTFTSPVSTLADDWMESNGDWFVKGSNADGQFWLVRNGVVIAATGDSITPGSSEHWLVNSTNAFRDVKGDNRGNYIISGRTSNADTTRDDVLVLNGTRVLAHESDPVDLNGNGLADDDMFIGIMQGDRSAFNNDGYYYFGPRVKNGAGTSPSQSTFLRVQAITLHCAADYNGDGDTGTDSDIAAFFACLAGNCCPTCGSADFNNDGDIGTDSDIESFFRVLSGGNC